MNEYIAGHECTVMHSCYLWLEKQNKTCSIIIQLLLSFNYLLSALHPRVYLKSKMLFFNSSPSLISEFFPGFVFLTIHILTFPAVIFVNGWPKLRRPLLASLPGVLGESICTLLGRLGSWCILQNCTSFQIAGSKTATIMYISTNVVNPFSVPTGKHASDNLPWRTSKGKKTCFR